MEEPERADPFKRSDWLSNIWMYVRSVEKHVVELEGRVAKLERLHKDHKLDDED